MLTDIDDLSPGAGRLELYVAMTRSRALLGLLFDRDTHPLYDDLVKDFADRMRRGLIAPN